VGQLPPFAEGRRWVKRASHARQLNQRVFFDPDDGYEYWPDPRPLSTNWHQIDWRRGRYRDLDADTGLPVSGHEGQWRPLR
jgi:hypothetical protein